MSVSEEERCDVLSPKETPSGNRFRAGIWIMTLAVAVGLGDYFALGE